MSVENGLFDPSNLPETLRNDDGPTVDAIALDDGALVLQEDDDPDAWLESDYWIDVGGDD